MPLVTSVLRPKEERAVRRIASGNIILIEHEVPADFPPAILYVLEQEPMTVRAVWKAKSPIDGTSKATEKHPSIVSHKIWVPWCYFMVRFTPAGLVTNAFLFLSPVRIRSQTKDKLFMPPLPNIYPSGHICTGTIRMIVGETMEKRTQDLFHFFWRTPFTLETWPKDTRLIPKILAKYGANSRFPWTILPAWEIASFEEETIDWKTFRYRRGRRAWRINTLAKAVFYAINFPHRELVYE